MVFKFSDIIVTVFGVLRGELKKVRSPNLLPLGNFEKKLA